MTRILSLNFPLLLTMWGCDLSLEQDRRVVERERLVVVCYLCVNSEYREGVKVR